MVVVCRITDIRLYIFCSTYVRTHNCRGVFLRLDKQLRALQLRIVLQIADRCEASMHSLGLREPYNCCKENFNYQQTFLRMIHTIISGINCQVKKASI